MAAEMAAFIFGNPTPANCAAAHRLLREDRVYFKTAGRTPPIFSPRPSDQVQSLQRQLEAQQKVRPGWLAGWLASEPCLADGDEGGQGWLVAVQG
jgi:hypothetical protein